MTNTLRWIGIGIGALFGVTVFMLVRSARGGGSSGEAIGDTGLTTSEAEVLTPEWEASDFKELARIAQSHKINPADLILIMASEAGLKPQAANRNKEGYPVAVGLIQLTAIANDAAGITEGQRVDVPNWSVAEQLPLVDRAYASMPWTKAGKSYDHAGTLYFANAAPGRMSRGTTPDVVIYDQIEDPDAYNGNKGFDNPGGTPKGYITVGDLIEHLRIVVDKPVYKAALQRLRDATGDATLSPRLPTG